MIRRSLAVGLALLAGGRGDTQPETAVQCVGRFTALVERLPTKSPVSTAVFSYDITAMSDADRGTLMSRRSPDGQTII